MTPDARQRLAELQHAAERLELVRTQIRTQCAVVAAARMLLDAPGITDDQQEAALRIGITAAQRLEELQGQFDDLMALTRPEN